MGAGVGGPCTPENQKCIGDVPKYTFHLADPTCDINDPSEHCTLKASPLHRMALVAALLAWLTDRALLLRRAVLRPCPQALPPLLSDSHRPRHGWRGGRAGLGPLGLQGAPAQLPRLLPYPLSPYKCSSLSQDMTKWAQLPVAIWNDQYYDNSAIYTGSTTIVDGKPVMMCPSPPPPPLFLVYSVCSLPLRLSTTRS